MHDHEIIREKADRSSARLLTLKATKSEASAAQTADAAIHELETAIEVLRVSQEELRSSNEALTESALELERGMLRYQELFDFAPNAYLVTDGDGMIREANRAAIRLLDQRHGRLVGRPIQSFCAQEDRKRLRGQIFRLSHQDATEEWEFALVPGKENTSRVVVCVAPARDRGDEPPRFLRWVLRTIPDRAAASAVASASMVAPKPAETKPDPAGFDRLAAGTAHYFHSYMGTITDAVEDLLREVKPGHPLYGQVHVIAHAFSRSAQLAQRLLTFTKQQVYVAADTDLAVLFSEVEPALRTRLGNARLVAEVDLGLPNVVVDADQFKDVLIELVSNARNALPQKNGVVEIRIAQIHDDNSARAQIRIDVRDNGRGMNEEMLAHATDPFFTTGDRMVVPGLGLPMVIAVLERAGATLSLRSQPDHGTLARITLPVE